MPISPLYKVDFSPHRKDLITQALSRMLSQHYDKCVLRQSVAAVMLEVNTLYDALIDLQEQRTIYMAEGENLDAIGRIVGEPRAPYQYDDSRYLFADRLAQRLDSAVTWCLHAPFVSFIPVEDGEYRTNILARIFKNHTLVSSIPEIERLTYLITRSLISYDKTGPMQVTVIMPSTITPTDYNIVIGARTNRRTDDAFMLPYPATLWFDGVVLYVPDMFFCPDRHNTQRCDQDHCAVGAPLQPGGYPNGY